MAQIDKVLPFILHAESGICGQQLDLPVEQMYAVARSKGVVTVTGDLGGPTLCGVTLATYRRHVRQPTATQKDLSKMSYAQWRDIVKSMFWDRWRADDIKNQSVANALVDWVWTSGTPGIKIPQRILGVRDDGIVGPLTLAAVNNYADQSELFVNIRQTRLEYLERICKSRPANLKFLKGWRNRVNKIKYSHED